LFRAFRLRADPAPRADLSHKSQVRAGWLPEYTLHLTKTITMRVADLVARDPGNGVTCSCTVCTFTHRGD
jgi:hypothetical protein